VWLGAGMLAVFTEATENVAPGRDVGLLAVDMHAVVLVVLKSEADG